MYLVKIGTCLSFSQKSKLFSCNFKHFLSFSTIFLFLTNRQFIQFAVGLKYKERSQAHPTVFTES